MSLPKCPESDFIQLFETIGAEETARRLEISVRDVLRRRARLEVKIRRPIKSPFGKNNTRRDLEEHPARRHLEIENGVVLVGSDAHYWPGIISTAHRAFVRFAERMKPYAIVMNGDELDGATISRHPPIGWEKRPSLIEELNTVKDRLEEIANASKNSKLHWPLGNHDARYETRLATMAPEYAKIHGVHLKDHFPRWIPSWSVWINDEVVIKHRIKNGIHATHNNTVQSGKTTVTGHLHSLKVTPWTDYNGTRWGVDTGALADPWGPQFNDYMEDGPRNWRSGFAVLTFRNGRLMWPEVVHVVDENHVDFRGELIEV